MHSYTELALRNTEFILSKLDEVTTAATAALQTSAATTYIKTLQAVQLEKVIHAVGVFSIFEARLQDGLACADGFKEAKVILTQAGLRDLNERFEDLYFAINVLKHGHGKSYNALCAKAGQLPFRVKLPGQNFFNEGDAAEVATLIEVDDKFVRYCFDTITEVSEAIQNQRPDYIG